MEDMITGIRWAIFSCQLKSSLRRRSDVLMEGSGQGTTMGTCIALSYQFLIPYLGKEGDEVEKLTF